MSNSRQPPSGPQVRAVAIGFSTGYRWRSTRSEWGQLIRAMPGMIRVRMDDTHLVIPPHQAVWIPRDTPHEVLMSGKGVLQRIYVHDHAARSLPRLPRVVAVSPLFRELLKRILSKGTLDRSVPVERHLLEVMLDECVFEPALSLELPMPTDPRARRAAEQLRDAPGNPSIPTLGRAAHASQRTLERLFRAETGLSLGAWQQRARLMHAMSMLADGATVTAAGAAVGYASTSAFVAAFRRTIGVTPGQYFRLRDPAGLRRLT